MADNDYEYRTGDRCGIDGCRSRRYRTNESGFEECDRGHQHGLARGNIDNDEDEFGINLRGKRFRKVGEKVKVYRHLKGKDAFELFLLCYQLILRKQVWWLVHEKRLPKELEAIVHDLWSLRVQNLRTRLKHENQPGTDAESGGDEDDVDSLFSSHDFDETYDQTDVASKNRAAKSAGVPNLPQALATMYIAAQILRLPIFLGDILAWGKSGSLLYHDAAAELPREMIDRLPSVYSSSFRPRIRLTGGSLMFEVTRLVLLFNKDFEMVMPALNVPPVLFRLIEELALPLEVYHAVRRLAVYMKFDFTYPPITKSLINILDFPEAQVLVCIVIILKIYYGLDGKVRIPTSDTNPATAVIDWDEWERLMKEREPLEQHEAIQIVDREVIDLPDSKIDDYLDFFQENFVIQDPQDREKDVEFHRMMLNLFPIVSRSTPRPDRHEAILARKVENIHAMQEALRPNRIIETVDELDLNENIVRPGEQYTPTRNMYQETGHTRTLFTALGRISGIPFKSVARAVVHGENLLIRLRKGNVKRGRPTKKIFKSRERLDTEDMMSDVLSVASDVYNNQGKGVWNANDEGDEEIEPHFNQEKDDLNMLYQEGIENEPVKSRAETNPPSSPDKLPSSKQTDKKRPRPRSGKKATTKAVSEVLRSQVVASDSQRQMNQLFDSMRATRERIRSQSIEASSIRASSEEFQSQLGDSDISMEE